MSLLTDWRDYAYNLDTNTKDGRMFWAMYFNYEKAIYEKILSDPQNEVKGTVKGLAEQFNTPLNLFVGFLDGINDSLVEPNPIDDMTEDTEVSLKYDTEKLYYNMVEAKADWLYSLPQWNDILPEDKRKQLYKEQKKSGTVIVGKKPGRNDPCPCGSGKKYKFCCGK